MRKAFLDTTILVDILLKTDSAGKIAKNAVNGFDETLLPQYAIKEFKRGPLRAYVWFHNKILSCGSWVDAIATIPLLFMQRNLMSTAMQSLVQFQSSISKHLPADFAQKYPGQTIDDVMREEGILWLKTRILLAWSKRSKVASKVVCPLSCYSEADPTIENSGQINLKPVNCDASDCCLRLQFVGSPQETASLLKACDQLPSKAETEKRRKILKDLNRLPNRPLNESGCRSLGDAVFALQCPKDAVILTTNTVDHGPLARALGVDAIAP